MEKDFCKCEDGYRGGYYTITLDANESCTEVPTVFLTTPEYDSEIMTSYSGEEELKGQIAIKYGYLQFPGRLDRLVMCSLWILLFLFILLVIFKIESIQEAAWRFKSYITSRVEPVILVLVCQIITCAIILNCSGIEFQAPTKIILYMISLISIIGYSEKLRYVRKILDRGWKRVFILFLYLYASFALVGQRIWIYPLTLKVTTAGLFVYVVAAVWFFPVINSVLFYVEMTGKYFFSKTKKMKSWHFTGICILILLVPAAYNLFANNPGISSTDTLNSMITNAKNLYGMYDWHPAFYCMVLRVIQKVWDSTYAVILVQYFFYAYVVTELLLYLRKKGIHESILIAVAIFTGLNAGNYLLINTIWKDIPYTLSIFWVLVLTAKFSIDFEEYKGKWYIYFEFVTAMVGMFFYRKNGMVSFIVIAVSLIVVLRKNVKLISSVVICIALIALIKGPVYSHFQIEDSGRKGMYIGLSQDILGAYYAGGEVAESTLQMINVMTSYNNAEYVYNPTWAYQSYDLDIEPKKFIRNYLDTFIKNPVTMLRAVIDREDAIWDIFKGEDARLGTVNFTETQDGVENWNTFYDKRIYRSLYEYTSIETAYTAKSQWLSAIEWRCGLFTLLGMITLVYLMIQKGFCRYLLIFFPVFGHILSLLLSTGWSDFRYFWPLNLMNMAIILLTPVIKNNGINL